MTLRYLLDTNVVSALFSPDPPEELISKLDEHDGEVAIPAPVWHELVYGTNRLPASRKRSALESFLSDVVLTQFPILPYDRAAAERHGLVRARLESLGRPAPFTDGQIASIAIEQELVLVTRNTKDFRGFETLELEDWLEG